MSVAESVRILAIESTELKGVLHMVRKKGKRRIKNDSRVFGLNNYTMVSFSEVEKLGGGGSLVKQIQEGEIKSCF